MNNLFPELRAAVTQYKASPVALSHQQLVTRLYRKSLKTMQSWAYGRSLVVKETRRIRAQFEQNRNIPAESEEAKKLVKDGYEALYQNSHPDPYVLPYMPGGTKFVRNPTPPKEAFPDDNYGPEQHGQMNVDWVGPPRPTVLVDSGSKVAQ